jgi:hypothetical protein
MNVFANAASDGCSQILFSLSESHNISFSRGEVRAKPEDITTTVLADLMPWDPRTKVDSLRMRLLDVEPCWITMGEQSGLGSPAG